MYIWFLSVPSDFLLNFVVHEELRNDRLLTWDHDNKVLLPLPILTHPDT